MGFKDAVKHSVDEILHHGHHADAENINTAHTVAHTVGVNYTELLLQIESLLKGSPVFRYFVMIGEDFQHCSHSVIDLLSLNGYPLHYQEALSITIQVIMWLLLFSIICLFGYVIEELFNFIVNKKSELQTLKQTNANLAQSLRMLIDKQSKELQLLTQEKITCERQKDVLEEELHRIMSQLDGNDGHTSMANSNSNNMTQNMHRGSINLGKVPVGGSGLRRKSSTYTGNLGIGYDEPGSSNINGSGIVDRNRSSIASASLASTIERNKLLPANGTNPGGNGLLARVWGYANPAGYMPSASSLGCVPKD